MMKHSLFPGAAAILVSLMCALAPAAAVADTLQDAQKLLKDGKHAQALDKAEQVLAQKPKDPQARFLKGLILTEMNKPGDAIAVFQKLTEDFPELPEPYNNLAVIYAQQKQFDKARTALEMAIRTHPSYAIAYENLGDVYARLASQAYDKALQIDSGNVGAQNKLAMIKELMTGGTRAAAVKPAAETKVAAAPAAAPAKPAAEPKTSVAAAAPAGKPPAEPKVIAPVTLGESPKPPAEAKAAAAPKPAPPPTDNGSAKAATVTEIEQAVRAWAAAWSRKDIADYLSHYAKDFDPPGRMSHAAWEQQRRVRVGKPGPIDVQIENLEISVEGDDRASARFKQHYRSANLNSSEPKTLTLVKRNGRWLIQREQIAG